MGLPPDPILATFHCIVLFSFRGQISTAGRFLWDELGFEEMWQRTSQSAFPLDADRPVSTSVSPF